MNCYRIKRLSNEEVITRVYNTDNKLFSSLYNCNKDLVIGYIRKNSRVSKDDALELYHLAFITFYENIQNKKLTLLNGAVSTYLTGVARNKLLEHQRYTSKKYLLEDSINQLRKDLGQIKESDDQHSLLEHRFKLMEEAIQSLGERCRNILNFYYFKEMSMSDIAQKLNFKSKEVAKNEKYKCTVKLKKIVNDGVNGRV